MISEFHISYEDLKNVIERSLANAGVPEEVSRVEAEIMAEADLTGMPSHGARMLPGLLKALADGRATPAPRLEITRERGATCVLDGDNGPGRYVSTRAMEYAVARSREFGAGVCVATRVTHWGRAYSYAYRAAQAECIGLNTTNAVPNMLAYGSAKPLLGNNPLAIGAPRGEGLEPLVLDIALSQAALGKVGTYLREGRAAPAGWGLDRNGQPTDDPAEILASRKVLPLGDHKGAGLSIMMELLTGALVGGLLSHEIAQRDGTGLDPNSTKFFLALDLSAFGDPARFAARVEALVQWLHHAEPGLDISLPGERGARLKEQYLRAGIPLHPDIVAQLQAAGIEI